MKTEAYKYFEYFCQMSSESLLIILSYTISKLVYFFWDSVWYRVVLSIDSTMYNQLSMWTL